MSIEGFTLDGLYRIDVISDIANGEIKIAVPQEWCHDPKGFLIQSDLRERPLRFFSNVGVTIQGMSHQVNFEIEAKTPREAFEKFSECAEAAATKFIDTMNKQRAEKKLLIPAGAMPPVH